MSLQLNATHPSYPFPSETPKSSTKPESGILGLGQYLSSSDDEEEEGQEDDLVNCEQTIQSQEPRELEQGVREEERGVSILGCPAHLPRPTNRVFHGAEGTDTLQTTKEKEPETPTHASRGHVASKWDRDTDSETEDSEKEGEGSPGKEGEVTSQSTLTLGEEEGKADDVVQVIAVVDTNVLLHSEEDVFFALGRLQGLRVVVPRIVKGELRFIGSDGQRRPDLAARASRALKVVDTLHTAATTRSTGLYCNFEIEPCRSRDADSRPLGNNDDGIRNCVADYSEELARGPRQGEKQVWLLTDDVALQIKTLSLPAVRGVCVKATGFKPFLASRVWKSRRK